MRILRISCDNYSTSTHEQSENSDKKAHKKPSAATRPNLNRGKAENKLSVFNVAIDLFLKKMFYLSKYLQ